MDDRSFFVVINPAAGRGRGARRVAGYRELLARYLPEREEVLTTAPGQETALVTAALERGFTDIIAIGGDGTWSLCADALLRAQRGDVTLGLLANGTGSDFGKSVGIRYENAESVLAAIVAGRRLSVDVGRVGDRHFLNVVGMGFDLAVIEDAASLPLLKGDLLYRFCALRQLFRYRGIPLAVTTDGASAPATEHLMLIVANANYFGGSFHIAPHARLDDGRLDAVSILDVGPFARARLFGQVSAGRHEDHPRVRIAQGEHIRIDFHGPLPYEVDGEVYTSDANHLELKTISRGLWIYSPRGELAATAGV